MSQSVHTLVTYSKLQPDTIAALFLLKKFGETKFPGVNAAKIELWSQIPEGETEETLEQKGFLLVDLGHGRFDHHRELVDGKPVKCASEIVAEHLGLAADPSLKKLLAYARRDDLEGKGTVSPDILDRAFGLSGLLSSLNRTYSHDLVNVVHIVLALFEAHYQEEVKRTKLMPAEWKQLSASGAAVQWGIATPAGRVRVVLAPSDNSSLSGFLRAYHHFDIVALRASSGHVNIVTNQAKRLDLAPVVALLREKEFKLKHSDSRPPSNLKQTGRMSEVPEWYYDPMGNSIQNGGVNPEGVSPTGLSDQDIRMCLTQGLQVDMSQPQIIKGVVWAAVKPESLETLEKAVPKQYEKTFHPHVTLAYDVTKQEFEANHPGVLGRQTQVLVTGYASNDLIQAALVDLSSSGLQSNNPIPHLTISSQKGITPVKSNEMLQGEHASVTLPEPLVLNVEVEFRPFQ